jgi:hypothetical protein
LDIDCVANRVLECALLHSQSRDITEDRVREVSEMGFNHRRQESIADELGVLESRFLAKTGDEKVQKDMSHRAEVNLNGELLFVRTVGVRSGDDRRSFFD